MNGSKQIKIGAMLSYFSIALNIISGLIYTPWMIEQIGESSYGLYTLSTSLISLFLVDFGLSLATSRYVAKYRAEGDQEKVNNFLGVVYKLYMIIDALIFVILLVVYFLLENIYQTLTPTEIEQLKVVYLISASFSIINFPCITFTGILNAYEKFIQLKVADLLYRVLLVGMTVVALILGYGLYALVAVHAAVGLIKILYNFIVIKKGTPVKANVRYSNRSLYKELFGFSLWVTVASLALRLIFNITPSVLGIVSGSISIAIFGIVTTIEQYTYTITNAINGMFMPTISKIYANSEENDINPLFLKVGKFQYVINGLIISGFVVVGKLFINLWVGSDFEIAYYGIILVLIPGLFYNSLQIGHTAMTVRKRVKEQALVHVATGVINVALSFVLSYFMGVIGACLSIFISCMIRSIIFNIMYVKILKLNIKAFAKQCYVKLSIPIILSIVIGSLADHFIALNGWWCLIVVGGVTAASYLLSAVALGLSKQEKNQIIKYIKNKTKR